VSKPVKLSPLPVTFKWSQDSAYFFQQALVSPMITNEIESFMADQFYCTNNSIEATTAKLSGIIIQAAKVSLRQRSSKVKKRSKNKINSQMWYTKSLREQRKDVRARGRTLCKYPSDPLVREEYFTMLKKYRKACRQACQQHRKGLLTRLEELNEKDPKAYWDLLKKLRAKEPDSSNKIDPTEWLKYFEKLNRKESFKTPINVEQMLYDCEKLEKTPNFTDLDFQFTEKEIMTAISQLKNNKACGPDGICNELLKYGTLVLLKPLVKLFNLIYTFGNYPNEWARGYIKPLHKKDSPLLPGNYRGITITSVIGKLFNLVINNRLVKFLKTNNIMQDEQICFQKKCRTSDHVFVIKTLMDQ